MSAFRIPLSATHSQSGTSLKAGDHRQRNATYNMGTLMSGPEGFSPIVVRDLQKQTTKAMERYLQGSLPQTSRPNNVWNETWRSMCDEIEYNQRELFSYPDLELRDSHLKNLCLQSIDSILRTNGSILDSLSGMPLPDMEFIRNHTNISIHEELCYNKEEGYYPCCNAFLLNLNGEGINFVGLIVVGALSEYMVNGNVTKENRKSSAKSFQLSAVKCKQSTFLMKDCPPLKKLLVQECMKHKKILLWKLLSQFVRQTGGSGLIDVHHYFMATKHSTTMSFLPPSGSTNERLLINCKTPKVIADNSSKFGNDENGPFNMEETPNSAKGVQGSIGDSGNGGKGKRTVIDLVGRVRSRGSRSKKRK
ncbi:hypothetical protein CTI12_AA215430 [Artemisia annua]|uniref:Uncharacterized protein n=1 Tax=Artemisia annua TaxID=35608 RepID=A0A2U1M365_ARTAN|nr:hypothetical protein CTI12_AA215430 [Artemisia annua]